jgi:cell fate (sporulation/competence/biofilm development) regulator YlbF (YheA/YmcA/DUF963 family)
MKLLLQTDDTPVIQKTRELCQTILDQPAYQELRQTIRAFLEDSESVLQYRRLCDKQDLIQAKNEGGLGPSDEELSDFEKEETEFLGNPLAAGFIEAQRKMFEIEKTIAQYVRRTFELDRLPVAADFSAEGCGCGSGGCGCQ